MLPGINLKWVKNWEKEIRTKKTYLYFICTDNPEINSLRIKNRIEKGGHNVPRNKIKARYLASLKQLAEAIKLVHRAYLFDNSNNKEKLIAEAYKGETFTIHTTILPQWFNQFVINKLKLKKWGNEIWTVNYELWDGMIL